MKTLRLKRSQRHSLVPQNLLVVRGARFHADAIRELLHLPLPKPLEAASSDTNDPIVFEDSLRYRGFAELIPEPDNEWDANAIAVMVGGRRVGYISKAKNLRIKPFVGAGLTVECHIFWNGDPDADFQFFTVQLFPISSNV